MSHFTVRSYSTIIYGKAKPYAQVTLYDFKIFGRILHTAQITFLEQNDPAQHPIVVNDNMISATMDVKMFDDVVDMLRNEKPVYFYWDVGKKYCYLAAKEEPVGEGE